MNATLEYHLEPDDPDRVYIEATFEDVDDFDDFYVLEYAMDEVVEENFDGFEARDPRGWKPVNGTETATIAYYIELDTRTTVIREESVYGDDGSWALINQAHRDLSTRNAEIDYRHTTPDGFVPEHEDHVYLKDDLEVASADTGDAGVTVIGTPKEMAESPQEVADALAVMTDAVEYGATDEHTTAYAVPDIGGINTYGIAPSNSFHLTESHASIYQTRSFWFHEQIHVVDGTDVDSDLDWFSEGYANYGAVMYGMETGHQDFSQYRNHLEDWGGDRVVLTEANQSDQESYNQGARVLAALDYEIRDATDGEATIEDVVREMHEQSSGFGNEISYEEFLDIVADVANEGVADDADTWLTTTEPILEDGVWDYDEHEAVFGPAPNIERTVTVTIAGEGTERTVELNGSFEEWVSVRENETLTMEIEAENTGGEPVTTRLSIDALLRPIEDRTTTTLGPGASDTMVRSYEFDADEGDSFTINEFTTLLVDGVSANTTVVDGIPAGADPAEPILLADQQDVTVGAGINTSVDPWMESNITIETLDSEIVAEESVPSTARTTTIDRERFDRSTTYAVTFDYFGDERTRYVSVLDPVNGTVPVDRNGDGLHRDIDGDGKITHDDVGLFKNALEDDVVQNHPAAYDFSGDGAVDDSDVIELSRSI